MRGVLAVSLAACLLVAFAAAANVPRSTGDVTVAVSGDFGTQGLQGRRCTLPQNADVTITVGDVTIALKVAKSPGVTHDAPVYIIGEDGQLRRADEKQAEAYALYHDTVNGAAMMITCPRDGEEHPLVEGTVLHQGRKHHLRQSTRQRRDVALDARGRSRREEPSYRLTEVPEPSDKGRLYDAVYPPGVHRPNHPNPPAEAARRNLAQPNDPELLPELHLKNPNLFSDDAGKNVIEEAENAINMATRRRRRRQAVNGQNVFIDAIAVIAYDIYKKYYDQSTAVSAADKETDALTKIKKNYALLMSEVDFHFQQIGSRLPYSLSMRLAGFAVSKTAATSGWTEDHKVSVAGSSRPRLDSSTALSDMRTWVQGLSPKTDYYILFSEYDLTSNGSTTNAGIAYVEGVCSTTGYNVAVVEADDFAAAILHTLHEVGHGLGADHDGDGNSCTAADNYIMEPGGAEITAANRANFGRFSSCSLDYFRATFTSLSDSSSGRTCMYQVDTPSDVPDVSGIIPGQLYNLTTQCKRAMGDASYVCSSLTTLGDSMCTRTFCSDPTSPGSCTVITLLRGTTCGDKKWCENGLCVANDQASSLDESCPFGDRVTAPYSNDPRLCSQLVAEEPSVCYSSYILQECCQSCAAAKGTTPGCEYGDRSTWCQASNCRWYTDSSLAQCCSTCPSETATTVAPAPTTPQATTTQATTTQATTTQATTTQATTTQATTTEATTTQATTTEATTTQPTTTEATTTQATTTQATTTEATTTQPTTTEATTTQPTTTEATTTQPTTTEATTTQPTTTEATTTEATTTQPTTPEATTPEATTPEATTTEATTTQATTTQATTTRATTTQATTPEATTPEATTTEATTTEATTTEATTAAPLPTTTAAPLPTGGSSGLMEGQRVQGNEQCRLREGGDSSAAACNTWMQGWRARWICSHGMVCSTSSDSCTRGSPRVPALNGTTCGNKRWCINGACVRSDDAPSADSRCLFGDVPGALFTDSPLTCADIATFEDGFCNYGTIRGLCCKSCGELRKLNRACPYGDVPGRPFQGLDMTCSELVAEHSGYCYQNVVRNTCCKSCSEADTGNSACRYGDRSTRCSSSSCSNSRRAARRCCSTCSNN